MKACQFRSESEGVLGGGWLFSLCITHDILFYIILFLFLEINSEYESYNIYYLSFPCPLSADHRVSKSDLLN